MKDNTETLKTTIAAVFGLAPEAVDEDTSIDTVNRWDSLRHLNLVLAIEEAFGISFTEEQTVEILSYPLIREVLKEHGVPFEESGSD